ncbi:MFS multidrug transporter [Lasiodiplodia theobromae]|uniref:MFS multidrug transporter n=1 Tax=Lasiodiplodia theobromae TaxID=45133 RepID=UPI0015C2E805|nr:MFS multidrug transporter [Lasiodiplodia theobromae]KAF4534551.1 MFS multidrug transporter [Lasiodiplodia theobromae]
MATDADSTQPLLASSNDAPSYGISSSKAQDTQGHDGAVHGVVHFAPGDPEDPRNWPRWKKWLMIGPILIIDLSVSWGASGFSPASKKFAEDWGLSPEAGTLGLSLYVLGLAFGPMTFRGWRDVFWALLGINGGLWAIMTASLLFCGETRHSIVLSQRAEKARKLNHTSNIDVPDHLKKRGVKELFTVTLTRPFRFLASEAIIAFAALYNGYLYGLSFLFNTAFVLVFGQGHGFDTIGVGICFLGICVGISLGPVTNIWQEKYYQRKVHESGGKNVPEARVQMGKLAAIAFPISLLWFAWTTSPSIHPLIPVLASALWGWSFYTLILMTFTYTEDSYKVYSASALAGIGLIRNLFGAAFPLFAHSMFTQLGYQWASTILAGLALVLVPIPFVWSRYGRVLREKSPWAREHMDDLDGDEGDEEAAGGEEA